MAWGNFSFTARKTGESTSAVRLTLAGAAGLGGAALAGGAAGGAGLGPEPGGPPGGPDGGLISSLTLALPQFSGRAPNRAGLLECSVALNPASRPALAPGHRGSGRFLGDGHLVDFVL